MDGVAALRNWVLDLPRELEPECSQVAILAIGVWIADRASAGVPTLPPQTRLTSAGTWLGMDSGSGREAWARHLTRCREYGVTQASTAGRGSSASR